MKLVRKGTGFGEFEVELDADETALVKKYSASDALDYAKQLGATNVRELLAELRHASDNGVSPEDYWAGPPDVVH